MSRRGELKVVTGNSHKFQEFQVIAGDKLKLSMINYPKLEIQADSLEEIVRFSAVSLYSVFREPMILEDSGLFIEALHDFPGPYTNYVKRTLDCEGVLKLMEGVKDRKATFRSVIAYVDDGEMRLFKGEVEGSISLSRRGNAGFGFDPIFIPAGSSRTFAEMSVEEKSRISHRAMAMKRFLDFYLTSLQP
ncbi:non-canonical purine NTP pyrophosphatase, rdgB/HAM1 family [Metallosphaera yellowstonensis MK1]|jgi:XTP/dITP diphosphohydrolase|uniref:dITP/XTP pyrophosphatase n=1 Tax=Metallosphaera yellowstonensis MK1 TaxID=671065 RepID=H2C711_9CREN|nr:XTP/dITP diphosphatase [Metallosphaera yellowstonensis]EHP69588.1 non-canonical purine NTP pyrophosphatase, rdgB/HAM1 family [Metallosphaera yellowstonensis MK1]